MKFTRDGVRLDCQFRSSVYLRRLTIEATFWPVTIAYPFICIFQVPTVTGVGNTYTKAVKGRTGGTIKDLKGVAYMQYMMAASIEK